MKNTFLTALLVTIGTSGTLAADHTWTGTISDTVCGAKHGMANMSDRECTQMCASHGAQYALIAEGKAYTLKNHDADLRTHAGHVVNLTGDLSGDTIKVSKVEMPKS
jgi:hypothetical protein